MKSLALLPRRLPLVLAVGAWLIVAGCRRPFSPPTQTKVSNKAESADKEQVSPDSLLDSAVQLLASSKRSPTAHQIAAQRLNQYLAKSRSDGRSLVEPLSSDTKTALAARLTPQQLQVIESEQFDRSDALHLEACFLLRDLVKHVTSNAGTSLARAEALFDWVICNVQIVPKEDSSPMPMAPGLTLLAGRGSELERAWAFMELLRQAKIDSVMVATLNSESGGGVSFAPWLPAALIDGELFLFDIQMGLAIPGPGGTGIATLRQVLDDPALITALDISAEQRYRARPEQLAKLVLLLESTPTYWAPRMRFLQDRLAGENRAVLFSDLAALSVQLRRATNRDVDQELWPLPRFVNDMQLGREYSEAIFGNSEQPLTPMTPYQYFTLADGRLLYLQGKVGDAIPVFMLNRVRLEEWVFVERNRAGLRAMAVFYSRQDPPSREAVEQVAAKVNALYEAIREDCTYFMGAAKFDQHELAAAASWMGKSYLEKYPKGRWSSGAHYYLGRCAEAQNDSALAIEHYTAEDQSPQTYGNLLRARRLGWDAGSKSGPQAGQPSASGESAKTGQQ